MRSVDKLLLVKLAENKKEVDIAESLTDSEKLKKLPKDIKNEWRSAEGSGKLKLLAKYGLLGTLLVAPGGIPLTAGYVGLKKLVNNKEKEKLVNNKEKENA